MARDESNREDLLREATAFVERVELVPRQVADDVSRTSSIGAPIVVGFRADDAASFFFGEDPVYQFNTAGELRRAYCDGLLIKSVGGRLVSFKRIRNENQVQLWRHDLSDAETATFLAKMANRLEGLACSLSAGEFKAERQVPANTNVLERVQTWLAERRGWPIAARPNA